MVSPFKGKAWILSLSNPELDVNGSYVQTFCPQRPTKKSHDEEACNTLRQWRESRPELISNLAVLPQISSYPLSAFLICFESNLKYSLRRHLARLCQFKYDIS